MKEQSKAILIVAILMGAGILVYGQSKEIQQAAGIEPQAVKPAISYTTATQLLTQPEGNSKGQLVEKPTSPVTEICKQTSVKTTNTISYGYSFYWKNLMVENVVYSKNPYSLLGHFKIVITYTDAKGKSIPKGEASGILKGGNFYNLKNPMGKQLVPNAPGGTPWFKDTNKWVQFSTGTCPMKMDKGQTGNLNFKFYVEWASYNDWRWLYRGYTLIAEDNVKLT